MKCPSCNQGMEKTDDDAYRFDEAWICRNVNCKIGYIAVIFEPGGAWKILSDSAK